MKLSSRLLLIPLALCAFAFPSRADDEPQPKSDDFPIDIPVPEGEPVKGIKVPYYGEDGTTLQMVIEADTAKRIDDQTIEMTDLRIDANSDDGRKLFVQMPQSVFHMDTRMLEGDDGVLIRREDFEITGRQGEFDIRKRFGKVKGNVKMIIFNLEDIE